MHWLLLGAFCLARVLTLIFGISFASLSQPPGFSLRNEMGTPLFGLTWLQREGAAEQGLVFFRARECSVYFNI